MTPVHISGLSPKKIVGALVTLAALFAFWQYVLYPNMPWEPDPSLNPDKSHTHADLRVWINGEPLEFDDDEYMSGLSYDDASHDEESEYLHKFLHLHDNVGHVVHRHKPGLDLAEFFDSVDFTFTEECLILDGGTEYCNDRGDDVWRMFVDGEEAAADPGYVFSDLESILLTYGSNDREVESQLRQMPDDACLYSQACPWRGDPPQENCVADPSIPCGDGSVELEDSLL